ncbi:hypothetical protein BV898_10415 [Hypsibius exemplaris]|uniref:Uncharacterized protein n=1 Tax=Hypsibius exemplaris TaxID=2072580 RepID=A0A1W0WJL7_HYPEX|nr:hypothetical protein BV898_10415 [Hypsibius exemplaris]
MAAVPELQALFERLQLQLYGGPDERTLTENAAGAFASSGDKCLDFFATVVRDTSVETVLQGFLDAWNEDPEKAVKLLLNLRDIRGGKGEKKVSLVLLYALSCWKPLTYLANLQRFLQVGCYKDLLFMAELAVRCSAGAIDRFQRLAELDDDGTIELKIIACQLLNDEKDLRTNAKASISLCAKWAPTEGTHYDRQPLRFSRKITKAMGGDLKKKDYRKRLSALRVHLTVLETLMCTGKWADIVFKGLPAKAHRRYRKAFGREENKKKAKSEARAALAKRYAEYLALLTKGEETIKSTGTQPHELIKGYLGGMDYEYDEEGNATEKPKELDLTIEGQWKDMISKLASTGNFKHVQAVCDVSGSMAGTPMEVAIALGLVVAELTAEPFHNKLITFSGNPELHTVAGSNLRDRVADLEKMEWGSNTDLIKVFELLLSEASKNPNAQMVEKLFIFTDMQFDEANQQEEKLFCFDVQAESSDEEKEATADKKVEIGNEAMEIVDEVVAVKEVEKEVCKDKGWATTYETICQMFHKTKYAVPKIVFWNLRATHKSFPVQKDEVGTALISGFSAEMMKAFLSDDMVEFSPLSIMNQVLGKYEITEIPKEERIPLTADEAGVVSFPLIDKMVGEFLVAKKVPKPRPKGRKAALDRSRSASAPHHDVEMNDSDKGIPFV